MIMNLAEIGVVIYVVNVILSIVIALMIIDKLYISKKFSKEKDFHFYNDLFSWEMFFIFIGIENLIKIISIFTASNPEITFMLLRIRILLLYFPFWNKLIHLEKVMNKITYERHYFAGMIPFFIVLLLAFTNISNFMLILIFLCSSLTPYLLLVYFLKNTGFTITKTLKIMIGILFIGFGCVLRPEILVDHLGITEIIALTNITAPISLILGTLLIFDSFRKEILINRF